MQLKGIHLPNRSTVISPTEEELPWPTVRVMVARHSLAVTTGHGNKKEIRRSIIGDSLEKALLRDTGYYLRKSNFIMADEPSNDRPRGIMIHHRFAFSYRLKRMPVLLTEDNSKTIWSVSKGASKTIKPMLLPDSIPADYDGILPSSHGFGTKSISYELPMSWQCQSCETQRRRPWCSGKRSTVCQTFNSRLPT
mmetsp:Transcript_37665/g.53117  ORF Transcript_37665/g.53117 Transcript_37665/m.53117 type:complete len:194 (+) Transcript_37665:197-778(+)